MASSLMLLHQVPGGMISNFISQLRRGEEKIISPHYLISAELAFYVKGNPKTYCINLGRRMNSNIPLGFIVCSLNIRDLLKEYTHAYAIGYSYYRRGELEV